MDAQGRSIQFYYDTESDIWPDALGHDFEVITFARLSAIEDAVGLITTIEYEGDEHSQKVSRINDPYGRYCELGYDSQQRVESITDAIGMQSSFSYHTNQANFIESLTTPYGSTRFGYGSGYNAYSAGGIYTNMAKMGKWLTATDPQGRTERLEYIDKPPGITHNWMAQQGMPQGNGFWGGINASHLDGGNTYYWDKKSWEDAPGDYQKAQITHWLYQQIETRRLVGIPAGVKKPLEGWVWFNYAGQSSVDTVNGISFAQPSVVVRSLGALNSNQIYRYQYQMAKLKQSQDPMGRNTIYDYSSNQIDLVKIRQKDPLAPGGTNTLTQMFYDERYLLTNLIDQAGQSWNYSYNEWGRLQTITDPLNQTISYQYDPQTAQLLSIQQPGRLTTSFSYDNYGRVESITDSNNDNISFQYDGLDRLTRIDYPDGSFQQYQYDKLDLILQRDRDGGIHHLHHNALGQLIGHKYPIGRLTQYQWCSCGSFKKLIDPMGRVTEYVRDIQGRVKQKIYPDGTTETYQYEPWTGRLQQITDALNQSIQYSYNPDNKLQQVNYTNSLIPTAAISY